jgi:DNA-binding MarR family transcriptional regulator
MILYCFASLTVKMDTSRAQVKAELLEALRGAAARLGRLNHAVGDRVELKAADLECLDLIAQRRAMTPSTLSDATGLHPATLTRILDRLERGGWVERVRDDTDRRRVTLRVKLTRGRELAKLYGPMAAAMDRVCEHYTNEQLALVTDFLRRTDEAGRNGLPDSPDPPEMTDQ